MVSTAKASVLTGLTNQKCGLKSGQAGEKRQNIRADPKFSYFVEILYFLNVFFCRYTQYGGAVPHRPVEDLAFAIARFVQNNGSFFNYYMVSLSSSP